MRLYVWNRPYSVRYGASCLYVVAETIEQARRLGLSASVEQYGEGGGSFDKNEMAVALESEPTRIIDAPCAEVYQWFE